MNEYRLPTIWVDQPVRNGLAEKYNLHNETDWKLLQWLIISGMRDHEDRAYVVVPQEFIHSLSPRSGVKDTLTSFGDRTGLPIRITDYSRWDGKATAACPELAPEIMAMVESAISERHRNKQEKVSLTTGMTWSAYQEYKELAAQAEIMESYSVPGHPAEELVRYLHSTRVRKALRAMLKRNHSAICEAIENVQGGTKSGVSKKDLAKNLYCNIQNSHMDYKAVDRTDRIYANGASLMQLPRDVRKAAFGGTVSIDAKNCQLAIVAELWEMPRMMDFLSTGESIWSRLAADLEVDLAQRKPELKTMLYCVIFGGGVRRLSRESDLWAEFVEHPFIAELLDYRSKAKERIQRDGCIIDAFGKKWALDDVADKKHLDERVRSLMSRQVQSYELSIMLAAFDAVKEDKDLTLVAWLHDGVYIQVTHNKVNSEHKINEVAKLIGMRALSHRIKLSVEVEALLLRH